MKQVGPINTWRYAGFQVSCQSALPVLRVGIDANTWGELVTENLYKYTFDDYLNKQLELLCKIETVLLQGSDDFVKAALNQTVDIFLVGPGVFVCLQVSHCTTEVPNGSSHTLCAPTHTFCPPLLRLLSYPIIICLFSGAGHYIAHTGTTGALLTGLPTCSKRV